MLLQMKVSLKYLILFVLLYACNGNTEQDNVKPAPLYPEPLSIALNISGGYTINPITGDSVKPLLNSYGDTVKTGVAIPFNGVTVSPGNTTMPMISDAVARPTIIIESNVQPIPEKLSATRIDSNQLTTVTCGAITALPVTEKKIPFREPAPVKALPLRFKDDATANIQYLDVDQGMSSSYIFTIIQDKRGNLWFSTDGAGISKYDGVTFTHYSEKEGLSNNVVSSLIEDRKGNLWIATNGGLNKFDGKYFTRFNENIFNEKIYSITEDNKGNIWFCSNKGVTRYDGNNFLQYTTKQGLPSDTVIACMQDKKGNLWFGTIHGVARFNGGSFTHYTKKDGLINDGIYSLLEDHNGNIWFGSLDGIAKYDGNNLIFFTNKDGLSGNFVWSMIEDASNNIWISTSYGGVNKFDGKTFSNYNRAEGLSNNKGRGMLEDYNGNIWLGTDGGGVNKLNVTGFSYLPPNDILTNNRVRPIIKDKKGNTWFGTEGAGIGKYNAAAFPGAATGFTYYENRHGSRLTGQRSLLEDKKGNIWIGDEAGMTEFDGRKFITHPLQQGVIDKRVLCMRRDTKDNLWFGTSTAGLYKYDGKSFIHYPEKAGLPSSKIFALLEDKKGNLWLGTGEGGFGKYDGTRITNYTEKEGFFGKTVTSIIEDKNGNFWLGTQGSGVCRFDGNNFTYYTEKEGLSNDNVWSIIEDSAGCIWVGTDKGLNRFIFNNNKYIIYQYGLQDGLKAIDFNLHSASIDNMNRLWWGTGKNIVIKDLNIPFKSYDVRSLKLTNIEINDRLYDYRNFPDSLRNKISFSHITPFTNYPGSLTLSYDLNHLNFHFSAIDWSAPGKIKYSYRMVGLEKDWSKPSGETMADYRNLSHGKYQFQVKAIGQSQVWTEPFTYSFIIRPAWWQTWWFKSAVIVLAALLLLYVSRLIYRSRLRKQKALMEKQLAVQMERQRISTEMHDDIGAGLSGVRLLTEMTKNKLKETSATGDIDKIHQSVGEISAKMKEVIWSLNTENDSLSNLIAFIQRQVKAQLENYPAELIIHLPDHIPNIELRGNTRRNIYLSVKEAIHNIIKHSGADTVTLSIACNENLVISIADNGRGAGAAQSDTTGNGMKNMRQRIEQLGGEFFIKKEKGITLTFRIPLKPGL